VRTVIVATLRDLQVVDLDEAAQMVSYSMRDNPANVRAFGIESAHQRSRSLVRFFRPVLRGLHKRGTIMGAFRDKALVGRSLRYESACSRSIRSQKAESMAPPIPLP
jgi:hypothetical protein